MFTGKPKHWKAFMTLPSRTRAEAGPVTVVVAHPDDEALWLSSAVGSAGRVVFCFGAVFERPQLSEARRRAVAALPLADIVDLAIPESGAGFSIDPVDPEPTATGIKITDSAARARYESNYAKLIGALRTGLAGFRDVYTHNPWGEYGHPEHIQVHRAVAALQGELGYTIWFANYVSAASWPLARRLGNQVCWTHRRIVQPDLTTARRLMRVYREHGAWTWTRAHRWPAYETMYAQPPADNTAPRHAVSGEWLLDTSRLRWWSPPWRFAHRAWKKFEER
jgi:LmbE family N-acetylglucosaminyl deacetylase